MRKSLFEIENAHQDFIDLRNDSSQSLQPGDGLTKGEMVHGGCAVGQAAMLEPTRRVATKPRSLGAAWTCLPIGHWRLGLRVLYDMKGERETLIGNKCGCN